MLRSEAARYARWSAAIALSLAVATAIVYLKRGYTSHIERKHAPPPAPFDVTRQSAGITFKKFDEQNHVVFTVQASKSTDFKGEDATLLEVVQITIFGKAGDRNDVIHTKSCRYGKERGDVTCSGDVQLDLMSAADAKRAANNPERAKALMTRVETRGVTFDRNSGVAHTDARLIFAFPQGSGDAIGMQYNSGEGTLQLLKEVRLKLLRPTTATSVKKKGTPKRADVESEVHVAGSSLDFSRDTRLMRLHGPAEAETAAERLTAGELLVWLDEDFHAQKMVAASAKGSRPALKYRSAKEYITLQADTLTAQFSP